MNWKIVAGTLAVALTWDEIALLKNKKTLSRMQAEKKAWRELSVYLANQMETHQVPMNEFDRIVINNLMEPLNK